MITAVDVEVPSPLSDCFRHSETICVRECCGIDAFSDDPALVAEWGSEVGGQAVAQALEQVEQLIAQVQNRSHVVTSWFLNFRTVNETGRGEVLSLLQAFQAALLACRQTTEGEVSPHE